MSARQVVTFGSCFQSSTFGGFLDLDKNLVRKVTSFRPTDFGTGPVPTRDKPKFHLAVLHFWWFLGLSQKSENRVRKVTSFRPTIFGRPVLSRIPGCGNPGVCSKCPRPSSNLEPSGLLSAVHTHNLAVYSKSGNFGHAHSLNTGAAKNGLRPKKPLNRGPEWEK